MSKINQYRTHSTIFYKLQFRYYQDQLLQQFQTTILPPLNGTMTNQLQV
jgi:hypothetical protein